MSNASKQITRHVTEIARRTAKQLSPIIEGTVISRNPDGSLNVYDGRGGCVRQAPAANVRVGQKIRLGVEPALGTQTNLPQVDLVFDPSSIPCPDDTRCIREIGMPDPCKPVTASLALAATVFAIGWVDPPPSLTYPGRSGVWRNRLSAGGEIAGGPDEGILFVDGNKAVKQSASRRSQSYTSHIIDPYADQVTLSAGRLFLSFDTSRISAGSTVLEAKLRVVVTGNTENRAITPRRHRGRLRPPDRSRSLGFSAGSTAVWS